MESARRNLPGASSLIEDLDSKVLVVLRDGKHIAGKLVSFDQFSNLVLEDAMERTYAGNMMSEDPVGCMIIRSDNIVMVGQLDEEKETSSGLVKLVPYETLEQEKERLESSGQGASNDAAMWDFERE